MFVSYIILLYLSLRCGHFTHFTKILTIYFCLSVWLVPKVIEMNILWLQKAQSWTVLFSVWQEVEKMQAWECYWTSFGDEPSQSAQVERGWKVVSKWSNSQAASRRPEEGSQGSCSLEMIKRVFLVEPPARAIREAAYFSVWLQWSLKNSSHKDQGLFPRNLGLKCTA